jgi:pimeloyl-ACP methyl ester carboxylesterase
MAKLKNRLQQVLIGSMVFGAGAWVLHQIRKSIYQDEEHADELHHVRTDDDIQLGIWRYRPESTPGEPVLLVHGFGLNHRHLDVERDLSLACYLRDQGYDVWAVDLRGRGASELPEGSWNFDDYVQKDLPAVVKYIIEHTQYPKLHWAAHSMGAMLFYAFAGSTEHQDKIASAVAGQGPFHGKSDTNGNDSNNTQATGYEYIVLPMMGFFRRLRIPWTGVARFGAFWYPQLRRILPREFIHIGLNPDNITYESLKKVSVRAVERVSPEVLAQFLDWALARHWTASDGTTDYRANIRNINVPTRVLAGAIDKLCPPHNQKAGYEELGTDDKDLIVAGKDEGFSINYSHLDFVQGENAPEEIFPLFDEWFRQHSIEIEETIPEQAAAR